MPNFKPKTKKKIKVSKKSTITLDSKHNEKITEFKNIKEQRLPQLEKQKSKIKKQLKKGNLQIENRLELQDKLKEIRKEIIVLKKKQNEYFLDNSEHIFTYFEKKKDVSEGNTKRKILHSFFAKSKKTTDTKKEETNLTQKYLCNIDQTFLNIKDYQINYEV